MTPQDRLDDLDILRIKVRTFHHYRPLVGRHLARMIADTKATRLRSRRKA